jgi:hypothetical protein
VVVFCRAGARGRLELAPDFPRWDLREDAEGKRNEGKSGERVILVD